MSTPQDPAQPEKPTRVEDIPVRAWALRNKHGLIYEVKVGTNSWGVSAKERALADPAVNVLGHTAVEVEIREVAR